MPSPLFRIENTIPARQPLIIFPPPNRTFSHTPAAFPIFKKTTRAITLHIAMHHAHSLKLLLLCFAGIVSRRQLLAIDYLMEENRVLRSKLGTGRIRFTDAERTRLARKAKRVGRRALMKIAMIVTPDTLLRWYRTLVARKYDSSKIPRSPRGRPRTGAETCRIIVDMAVDNPTWGYTRIRDALNVIGIERSRETVRRVLQDNGIVPAPERRRQPSWGVFIESHLGRIAAMDFFTVEVLTWFGIIRYHVLFVIDIATRKVEIAGIVHNPHDLWMRQIAKNLTDPIDGFLKDTRYIIHDRDPLFTRGFRNILKGSGVEPVRLPRSSPNLNAYAERFVLSIKSECLDKVIPLGEEHLRHVIREYMCHYHAERPHQGLCNSLIRPLHGKFDPKSPVRKHSRLGGLLNFYSRSASY